MEVTRSYSCRSGARCLGRTEPPGSLRFARSRRDGAPAVGLPAGPTTNAKATVLVAVRVTLPILLPEQVQGDPRTPHLAMHRRPDRLGTLDRRGGQRRKQRSLQGRLGHAVHQRPGEPGQSGPAQVVTDRRRGGPHRLGNLPVGTAALMVQPQNFFILRMDNLVYATDTSRVKTPGCHGYPANRLAISGVQLALEQVSSLAWNTQFTPHSCPRECVLP